MGAGAKGLVVMEGFSPRRLEGRRGDIFHREDAKGAKVGYCQAGWFSDPWHGDLACVFVFGSGEPGAGADGDEVGT